MCLCLCLCLCRGWGTSGVRARPCAGSRGSIRATSTASTPQTTATAAAASAATRTTTATADAADTSHDTFALVSLPACCCSLAAVCALGALTRALCAQRKTVRLRAVNTCTPPAHSCGGTPTLFETPTSLLLCLLPRPPAPAPATTCPAVRHNTHWTGPQGARRHDTRRALLQQGLRPGRRPGGPGSALPWALLGRPARAVGRGRRRGPHAERRGRQQDHEGRPARAHPVCCHAGGDAAHGAMMKACAN